MCKTKKAIYFFKYYLSMFTHFSRFSRKFSRFSQHLTGRYQCFYKYFALPRVSVETDLPCNVKLVWENFPLQPLFGKF